MTAVGILIVAAGVTLLWAGITGTSITDALSSTLSGRKNTAPTASLRGDDLEPMP